MKTYKYSVITKITYRYANIPVTVLLLLYLISSIVGMLSYWYYFFFVALNLFLIISLNKYFIKSYKLFPFTINADNEKIICSDFFFSKNINEIKMMDIDQITGGIFSGFPSRPIYIHDSKQNITVGFYANAGKFSELLKTILQNINDDLYADLTSRIKDLPGKK